MRKVLATLVCVVLVMTMFGCTRKTDSSSASSASSSQSAASSAESAKPVELPKPKDLEVIESGWSVNSSGYIQYGIGIKNPNADFEAKLFTVTASGKDPAGRILFSEYMVVGSVPPNSEYYFGAQIGNGARPSHVEFIVSVSDDNWVPREKIKKSPTFEITSTNVVPGNFNMTSFTGEITAKGEDTKVNGVWISVILRNKENKIVGGYYSFTDIARLNQKYPFEVRVFDPVEYETYKLYAYSYNG